MQLSGHIKAMETALLDGEAQYQLPIGEQQIDMNALIGQRIELAYKNVRNCDNCGNEIKLAQKIYPGGHCAACFFSLAKCDMCIMKPETCHYDNKDNPCREPEWGLGYCFQPTVVYLSNTAKVKVGITNKKRVLNRWIEQGAVSALPILEVKSRRDAGHIEVALKAFIGDKTNWRNMLKNEVELSNLTSLKASLLSQISEEIEEVGAISLQDDVININYPVLKYPTKIISLNFDTTSTISGVLNGIKGQYLLLEGGVLNVRKFSSYHLTLST